MELPAGGTGRVSYHPNRLPFEGVLTLVDVASDEPPSGARGHRVILMREAAENALPSLLGMAVDYKADFAGHNPRQKCGIITAAEIDDNRVLVSGYLYSRDFPEFARGWIPDISRLGMSYELATAHVVDMREQVWTFYKVTFCGAAILLRERAAFRETSFCIDPKGQELAIAASAAELGCR
jgi:hypothetical protein